MRASLAGEKRRVRIIAMLWHYRQEQEFASSHFRRVVAEKVEHERSYKTGRLRCLFLMMSGRANTYKTRRFKNRSRRREEAGFCDNSNSASSRRRLRRLG